MREKKKLDRDRATENNGGKTKISMKILMEVRENGEGRGKMREKGTKVDFHC